MNQRCFFLVATSMLLGCQSTDPSRIRRDVAQSFDVDSLSPPERLWVRRTQALHAFLTDYYRNPRNFKARGVLGLSEMQKIILRNRSEAWQPHLADRTLRVSILVSEGKTVSAYRWQFSKDWQKNLQARILSRRREWTGSPGLTLWILPAVDFASKLSDADHAWLMSMDVVATDPTGRFFSDDETMMRKLAIDEHGVYLESVMGGEMRVRNRVSLLLNDVSPIDVDSSHRFLNREISVIRARDFLESLERFPDSNPQLLNEVAKYLNAEREGRRDAIDWLEKNFAMSDRYSQMKRRSGFPGLWEAYLRGIVGVFNVPGLEFQSDPGFLSHIDALLSLYKVPGLSTAETSRKPGSAAKAAIEPVPSRTLGLEVGDGGPVLGLF